MSFVTILANWKNIVMGALALACVVFFGLWKMEESRLTENKLAQMEAIKKAQDKADALSNELVIEQAKALAITAQKETVYVDRIKAAPDNAGKLRSAASGMRELLHGSSP